MRPLALAALALIVAAPAAAQEAPPSRTHGFFVGAHLQGTAFDTDLDDDLDAFTGGGLGVEVGYGFRSGLALLLSLEGSGLDRSEGTDEVRVERGLHADLLARVNFGGGRRALVPFFEGGVTGFVLEAESDSGVDLEYSGAGVTIGGGIQYFVRRNLSLNAGLRVTYGGLTDLSVDGDGHELDDQFFSTGRLRLGVTWHP